MTDVAFHSTHRKEYQSKLVVVLSKGSQCNFWGLLDCDDRRSPWWASRVGPQHDTVMISMSFNSYATQAIFFIIPAWHRVKYGLDNFFGPFFGLFFWTILEGGSTPLLMREGWDEVYQYWGRGGRQSVISRGWVWEGLFLRREGWEVVIMANTTG